MCNLHMATQVRDDRAHLAAHGALRQTEVFLLVMVERFAVLVRTATDVAHVAALG